MTLLTGNALREYMRKPLEERLVVTPLLSDSQIGEASVDVRLGSEFVLIRKQTLGTLDLRGRHQLQDAITKYQQRVRVELNESFVLHPNQLVLAATLEYIRLPNNLSCYVIGKSSWGRLGLVIATATSVAPSFKGSVTLELVNLGEIPILLYPGIRIAQLVFHETLGAAEYSGRYAYPTGPQFSRVYSDDELDFWCGRRESISEGEA